MKIGWLGWTSSRNEEGDLNGEPKEMRGESWEYERGGNFSRRISRGRSQERNVSESVKNKEAGRGLMLGSNEVRETLGRRWELERRLV